MYIYVSCITTKQCARSLYYVFGMLEICNSQKVISAYYSIVATYCYYYFGDTIFFRELYLYRIRCNTFFEIIACLQYFGKVLFSEFQDLDFSKYLVSGKKLQHVCLGKIRNMSGYLAEKFIF